MEKQVAALEFFTNNQAGSDVVFHVMAHWSRGWSYEVGQIEMRGNTELVEFCVVYDGETLAEFPTLAEAKAFARGWFGATEREQ